VRMGVVTGGERMVAMRSERVLDGVASLPPSAAGASDAGSLALLSLCASRSARVEMPVAGVGASRRFEEEEKCFDEGWSRVGAQVHG
jgi:hypothetical protein